jgi:PST family polysaccharide transporter
MFTVGFAFMLAGLLSVVCQLLVRYIINQRLNLESVGYFQAAWQISMTYITFLLGAMAVDYFPRLTQKIHNKSESNRLVNEQTELAIAFAAPVLITMLAFAPVVINLLYSSEFGNSVEILRWQVFGDTLKIISWPLGFIILAKGHSKLFFWTELLWNASYITLVYSGIELFGIEITGYAFAASYAIYLLTVYVVSRSINDFRWDRSNIKLILLLTLATASLLLVSYFSILGTIVLGIVLIFISTIYALNLISHLELQNPKLKKILSFYKKCTTAFNFKGFS